MSDTNLHKSLEAPIDVRAVQSDAFDIMEYVAILRRRWPFMLLAIIMVTALGVIYTMRQPKIYQASTVIVLNNETLRPLGRQVEGLESTASYYLFNKDYRNTQAKVITSRPVLEKVVANLQLATNYSFLGIDKLPPLEAEKALSRLNPTDILARQVAVSLSRDSDLATITVKNRNPELARMIATEVVNGYNTLRRENKISMIGSATSWLVEQEGGLLTQLNEAEKNLLDFQKANNIEATSFEAYESLIADKQKRLSSQLMDVKTDLWRADVQLKTLTDFQNDYKAMLASPLTLGNATLDNLREVVLARQQEFSQVVTQYGPKHPAYKAALEQLEAVENSLKDELKLLVNRAKQRKIELDRTVNIISQELARTRQEALRLNSLTVEYQRRNYELTNYRNLYALVIKRSKETQLSGVAQFVDVEIVEHAVTPQFPISPRVKINILLSFVLGLFMAIVLAFILETLDTKLSGREEAEKLVHRPMLGALTQLEHDFDPAVDKSLNISEEELNRYLALNERRRVEYFPQFFPKSSLAESIRFIRINLLAAGMENTPSSLLLTSANPKEGKSTVTNFVAASLAALGKKVIVIDTDLHKPMVHRIYDLKNNIGISSVLTGRKTLDEAIRESDIPGLSVLTSGPLPPNSAELLSSPQFRDVVAELKNRFDYVVFDSPPLMALGDALIISRVVDNLLLVVRPGLTDRVALRSIATQLQQMNAPLIGFVFNATPKKSAYTRGGYYRYGYHYYSYSSAYSSAYSEEGSENGEKKHGHKHKA